MPGAIITSCSSEFHRPLPFFLLFLAEKMLVSPIKYAPGRPSSVLVPSLLFSVKKPCSPRLFTQQSVCLSPQKGVRPSQLLWEWGISQRFPVPSARLLLVHPVEPHCVLFCSPDAFTATPDDGELGDRQSTGGDSILNARCCLHL